MIGMPNYVINAGSWEEDRGAVGLETTLWHKSYKRRRAIIGRMIPVKIWNGDIKTTFRSLDGALTKYRTVLYRRGLSSLPSSVPSTHSTVHIRSIFKSVHRQQ